MKIVFTVQFTIQFLSSVYFTTCISSFAHASFSPTNTTQIFKDKNSVNLKIEKNDFARSPVQSVENLNPNETKDITSKTPSNNIDKTKENTENNEQQMRVKLYEKARKSSATFSTSVIFDLPVTYNSKVSFWISHFQNTGKNWFRDWLERAGKYMPLIQKELRDSNLPLDLAYMAMIESGFKATAVSHADAVGPWQFIKPTGERYGLKINWWLDERRDLKKSTNAAIRYMRDLYQEFGSWYLVAASYNMGENGLRKQIIKYKTRDYWTLCKLGALPRETMDYVPKILAAMMIAKSPNLYGFKDLSIFKAVEYDLISVPGGTEMSELADQLGVTTKALLDLNAELLLGYVPRQVEKTSIRVPRGSTTLLAEYLSKQSVIR